MKFISMAYIFPCIRNDWTLLYWLKLNISSNYVYHQIVVVPPGYCMVALQTLIINTQIRFIKHTGSPDCSQTASQLARQLYPNPGCSLLVGILSSLMSPMVVLRSSDESLWESSGLQVSSSKSSACQCLTLTVSSLSAWTPLLFLVHSCFSSVPSPTAPPLSLSPPVSCTAPLVLTSYFQCVLYSPLCVVYIPLSPVWRPVSPLCLFKVHTSSLLYLPCVC